MMPSRLISAKEMADAESRSGSNISELAALPTKCAESVSYYKAAAKNKECNRPMELLYYRWWGIEVGQTSLTRLNSWGFEGKSER